MLQPWQQLETEPVAEREANDAGAVGVGVVGFDLGVGAVAQQPFDHRGDLAGGAGRQLAVDAGALALDVPVDHHAWAAVAGVVLGHEVGLPGAEALRIAGAGGAGPPEGRVTGGERLVDEARDRPAQVLTGDVGAPYAAQRAFGLVVLAGGDDPRRASGGTSYGSSSRDRAATGRRRSPPPGRRRMRQRRGARAGCGRWSRPLFYSPIASPARPRAGRLRRKRVVVAHQQRGAQPLPGHTPRRVPSGSSGRPRGEGALPCGKRERSWLPERAATEVAGLSCGASGQAVTSYRVIRQAPIRSGRTIQMTSEVAACAHWVALMTSTVIWPRARA